MPIGANEAADQSVAGLRARGLGGGGFTPSTKKALPFLNSVTHNLHYCPPPPLKKKSLPSMQVLLSMVSAISQILKDIMLRWAMCTFIHGLQREKY